MVFSFGGMVGLWTNAILCLVGNSIRQHRATVKLSLFRLGVTVFGHFAATREQAVFGIFAATRELCQNNCILQLCQITVFGIFAATREQVQKMCNIRV